MTTPVGLVVDDDDRVRCVLAEALRLDGMHVLEASSGSQALTLMAGSPVSFVLTDIDMPGIDGPELCRRLRSSAATTALPIVVVSGAGATQVEQAKAAGCDAVLAKPCSLAELVATSRSSTHAKKLAGQAPWRPAPRRPRRVPGRDRGERRRDVFAHRVVSLFAPRQHPAPGSDTAIDCRYHRGSVAQ